MDPLAAIASVCKRHDEEILRGSNAIVRLGDVLGLEEIFRVGQLIYTDMSDKGNFSLHVA